MKDKEDETRIQQLEGRVFTLETELASLRSKLEALGAQSSRTAPVLNASQLLSEVRNRWHISSDVDSWHETTKKSFVQVMYPEAANCLSKRRLLTERLIKCSKDDSSLGAKWSQSVDEHFIYLLVVLLRKVSEDQNDVEDTSAKKEGTK